MNVDQILEGMQGKSAADLGANGTPDEVRGRTPDELHQLVEVLDAHLRSLHQEDTGELRDLTPAEDMAFQYGLRVREAAVKKIEEHRAVSEVFTRRPKAVQQVYANLRNGLQDHGSVTRMTGGEVRDAALRVLDSRSASAHLSGDEKSQVERQVRVNSDVARRILVTENDAYRSAFLKLATQVDGGMYLDDEERNAMRAYAEYRAASLANASGGYGVPVKLAA